ncbi:phosphoglycerate mutase family protein [Pseudalkalibacillus hwajinpoensis]|uniref:phosphoglycerate mutase family protein n=1 Tax=Guptibacillus hwajinpoensis TaxID=208199 RepID=UPI00325B5E2A
MTVLLIRHGKSVQQTNLFMNSSDFQEWVKIYNEKGIEDTAPLPVKECLTEASAVFTSDLNRSIQSADKPDGVSDCIFRELELPVYKIRFIKLRPSGWIVLYRLFWYLGRADNSESVKQSKERAEKAASILENHATTDSKVVLVGHGFFNRFIGSVLQKRGWTLEGQKATANWTMLTYRKEKK